MLIKHQQTRFFLQNGKMNCFYIYIYCRIFILIFCIVYRDTLPSLSQVSIYGTVATTTAATAAVAPIKNYNTSLHSFVHNNSKFHTYQNISPAELRTQYQHQYQLQHQYLKSYKRTQDHQFENQTDDKPYYYPFQTDSSFTDATSSSTPLPARPLAPQPPSSSLQPPTMPIIAEDNPLKIVKKKKNLDQNS